MNLLKKVFGGGKEKPARMSDLMRATEPVQTPEETESIRNNMEAEMLAERQRREAKADEGK